MANPEHLKILKQGVEVWNRWRVEHPEVRPDLHRVDLHGADLRRVLFSAAVLIGADLRKTDLRGARLYGTDLSYADLYGADLRKTDLRGLLLHQL